MSLTEECHANAQSAVKVLNDLLNYDKIEDGTLNLDLAIISMWELIETTVTEFRLQAKKAKVKLLLDYGEVLEQGANTKKGSRDVEASRGMSQHEDVSDDLKVLRVPGDVVRLAQVRLHN
jgi:signal transduction histidine kinase